MPSWLQAVAVGEVAEGGVARDELVAAAPGEARLELAVERAQVGDEGLGVRAVGRGVVRVGAREPLAEGGHDGQEPRGVEPEVRVLGPASSACSSCSSAVSPAWSCPSSVAASEVGVRGDVDPGVRRLGRDGLVDGGLEAREVHDDVGAGQAPHRLGCQLEVVGLGAGLREAGDLDVLAADPLGRPLERVEGRGDPIRSSVAAPPASADPQAVRASSAVPRRRHDGPHDNDSQQK